MQPLYHIDFIWNFTEAAKRLKEYNQYGRSLFEKVQHNDSNWLFAFVLISIFNVSRLNKAVHSKTENGDSSGTFIGRLIDVSESNPKFTIEDVFAETATILAGVFKTSKHGIFSIARSKEADEIFSA